LPDDDETRYGGFAPPSGARPGGRDPAPVREPDPEPVHLDEPEPVRTTRADLFGRRPRSRDPWAASAGDARAGFWPRFGALIVDSLILAIPVYVLGYLPTSLGYALSVGLSATYFTWFEGGETGQTPGKRLFGIRVVSIEDGGPLGFGRGFVRWIGRYVSSLALLIGYLWMLWDAERQCWHDKMARAVVVPAGSR
jgi:uncharacterized RDD family membrane protein YckC